MGFADGELVETTTASDTGKLPNYKLGKPYKIAGRRYEPVNDPAYDEVGQASWYGNDFHGQETANGEVYDMTKLTAAHPTLPMPTYARVVNLENGRSVVVRINDRGPFASNRVIDLSRKAANKLGFIGDGTAKVRVQNLGSAHFQRTDEWISTAVRDNGDMVTSTRIAASSAPTADSSRQGHGGNAAEDDGTIAMASRYASAPDQGRVARTFSLFDRDASAQLEPVFYSSGTDAGFAD